MICPKCDREIPDDSVLCCYCARYFIRKPAHPHQRPNGSGYVYKRGKTWTAVYTRGYVKDEQGKRHQLRVTKGGFRTKSEALEECARLKSGELTKAAPFLAHYWDLYRSSELTKLSNDRQTAYEIAWKKLGALQYRRVDTITVADLRTVVKKNAPTFYPARDMKTILRKLFRLAGADRFADKTLPDYIDLPELEEKERTPFSEEEQKALWRVYDAGDWRAAVPLVMIYTGMMPGEFMKLKIPMIDIDNQRIVGASIKTKVRRASPIFLPDTIIPLILDLIQLAREKHPKVQNFDGYILPHSQTIFYRDYYAALEAAGCRRLEPYSCRHTTATALVITEGIAPQTVKKVMRWSTTKMLDRYVHPDDQDALAAVNTLSR